MVCMVRTKKTVGIINIAGGNIKSLYNAIDKKYYSVFEISDISKNIKFDAIIFPGVGNIASLSKRLFSNKNSFIYEHIQLERKIIGICMGFQILSEYSMETKPDSKGLSLLEGYTDKLKSVESHIGWNSVNFSQNSIFAKFDKNDFYFNHKYKLHDFNPNFITGSSHINEFETIPAVFEKNNLIGFQFHPEKSQLVGNELLNHALAS